MTLLLLALTRLGRVHGRSNHVGTLMRRCATVRLLLGLDTAGDLSTAAVGRRMR
jgi:hypothetical protein